MSVVFYLILVLHIVACLFLIAVVLLQQGKGQDLASAFGGAGTQTAFGPRGGATVLSRATTILAGAFMVTSLLLSILPGRTSSVLESLPAAATPAPAPTVPSSPAQVPAASPAATPPAATAPTPAAPTGAPPAPSSSPTAK